MKLKDFEEQIGISEVQLPKIFGENVQQISARFNPNAVINSTLCSIYPGFSKKRLYEFLAGRICAAKAIDGFGDKDEILPIGKNKLPQWPPGITGSITHTENMAAAVISASCFNLSLGLDLENIFKKETAEELEKIILLEKETRYLNLESYCEVITLIYSAKEAVFKAVNSVTSRFFDFKEVELTTLNLSSNFFEAKLKYSKIDKVKGKFAFFDSMVLTGAEINN